MIWKVTKYHQNWSLNFLAKYCFFYHIVSEISLFCLLCNYLDHNIIFEESSRIQGLQRHIITSYSSSTHADELRWIQGTIVTFYRQLNRASLVRILLISHNVTPLLHFIFVLVCWVSLWWSYLRDFGFATTMSRSTFYEDPNSWIWAAKFTRHMLAARR